MDVIFEEIRKLDNKIYNQVCTNNVHSKDVVDQISIIENQLDWLKSMYRLEKAG